MTNANVSARERVKFIVLFQKDEISSWGTVHAGWVLFMRPVSSICFALWCFAWLSLHWSTFLHFAMSGCLLWKFVHRYINISSEKVCHFSWIFSDHFDCVSFDCDSQWSWRTPPVNCVSVSGVGELTPVNCVSVMPVSSGSRVHRCTPEQLRHYRDIYPMPPLLSLDQLSGCRDLGLVRKKKKKKKDKKRNVW